MSEQKVKGGQYAKIIGKSTEAKDQQAIEDRVDDARIQLNADVHAAKKEVRLAERAVEEQIAASYFNSANIIEAKKNFEVTKADYAYLVELQSELF